MISSIEKCKKLTSLGLDFGGLRVTSDQVKRLSKAIGSKNGIVSLALGFHKVENIENDAYAELIKTVDAKIDNLRMLRLNFSNTCINRENLVKLNEVLKKSSITHLELFLGGNDSLDNELAKEFLETFKLLKLRGFEFDAGFSNCTGDFLEKFGFSFSSSDLSRFAFYLNG